MRPSSDQKSTFRRRLEFAAGSDGLAAVGLIVVCDGGPINIVRRPDWRPSKILLLLPPILLLFRSMRELSTDTE